ncbi:MAG: flippase [Thiobacillus sp.]|nr:flippase [Thiobacillus sp.]
MAPLRYFGVIVKMTPAWLKFLPATMRIRVEHRPNLQKALTNTGWLFGDRVLRMGVGLLVGVWVARYLGPEQFGLLNYAMAIVALFGAIASLGLNGIVVRDLVKEPETANETLGTTFLLQAIGGLLAFGLAIFTIGFARPNDNFAKLLVAVLGFVMVFKSTDVVRYWFESQVKSKYVVWLENGIFLVLAVVKVGLILMAASLMAFVWVAFAEGVLVAVGLLGVYAWRGGALSSWRIHYGRAKTLLKDSWPLILSGLAVMVYMRIDQVMLGQMLGDEAVGIYSAAVRVSEVWYFIPMAIAASVFPSIIEAKKQSEDLYCQRIQKLYDLMVLLALTVAIPMTFLSEWAVVFLFGNEYLQAAPVLSISIWAGVSVALSAVHGKWLLTEGMQNYALLYTSIGCLINIVLNIYFIKKYGVVGAAFATVAAQTLPYFLLLLTKKTRRHLIIIIRAFNLYRVMRRL